jgi:hypothetical protein
MCECAGHRPAAFGAQVAGSTTLDEQLAAGATLTPLVRSYHRATAAESLAAIEADMAREADRGDEAAARGDDAAFRES